MTKQLAPVSGIILAAGSASRMGRDKLMLPFRGKAILQHVIDSARACGLEEVIVVLPENSEAKDELNLQGCRLVRNGQPDLGQAASLALGLRQASGTNKGAMVLPGDLPLITPETLDHLLWNFTQEVRAWIAPVHEGLIGNPLIIPCGYYEKVFELTGDAGPRDLLSLPQVSVRQVEARELGPFVDIDTSKDYDLLLQRYEKQPWR